MKVSSRARSHAPARASGAESSGPPEQAVEWARRIAALLDSANPQDRAWGIAELRQGLHANWGPYLRPDEMFAALCAEVDRGAVRESPEARVELARVFAERGDAESAKARLFEACRVAADRASSDDPAERQRASSVNNEASVLFYRMGDRYQGDARYAVSRYYSTPPSRRYRGDLVPYVPGGASNTRPGPSMHAPWPHVEVPPRLQCEGRDPDSPAPPRMEGRPVPVMQGLDAINALGAWVGACRDLNALAGFLERCERAYLDRNFLRAPLEPAEVRDLKRSVLDGLDDPDPKTRATAWRLYRSIDFDLLEDCSRAYWGRTL
jgi:hypothetical protein